MFTSTLPIVLFTIVPTGANPITVSVLRANVCDTRTAIKQSIRLS